MSLATTPFILEAVPYYRSLSLHKTLSATTYFIAPSHYQKWKTYSSQATSSPVILATDNDGVATLTLNKYVISSTSNNMLTFFSAQQRNALSLATLQELKNQFDKIHKDTAIRVVILKAEGPVFRYAKYLLYVTLMQNHQFWTQPQRTERERKAFLRRHLPHLDIYP